MGSDSGQATILRRGALGGTGGVQAEPASGATITIWDSTANSPAGCEAFPRASRYRRLQLYVNASHDSGSSGVIFYGSSDGVTWAVVQDNGGSAAAYTYTASNGGVTFTVPCRTPHMKVTYTNSANALTRYDMSLIGDARGEPAA
jgi:hypothetical protein